MIKTGINSATRWTLMVCMAIGLVAGRAAAQEGPDPMQGQKPVPIVGSEFRFVPGSWGVYTLKNVADKQEYQMRFSILDQVKQRKGKAYWMEIEIESADNPTVITRMLVPDTGNGPGDPTKAYVQIDGYRPFEIPRKYLRPDPKAKQEPVGQFIPFELVGDPETKTLQWKGRSLEATTVEATDEQGRSTTVVASLDAPPLGIVKLNSPDVKMELLDWGDGAATRITGKPVGLWRWVWGVAVTAARDGAPE
jgi:hypothetical protein